MSKAIKIISAVGVLVVALIVASVAIIKSIDFNQYKGEIARQAKAATGRDLTIAGDLDLSLSLSPRIAVDGVTFSNADWGSRPDMVTIKRFVAEMSLMPLLSGDIKINQVILEGVDLLAEKNQSGKANWEFGPAPEKKQKQTDAQEGNETHTQKSDVQLPVINMVSLKDVNVIYKDAQAGQEYTLNLATVDLKSGGLSAPLDLLVTGTVNAQAFSIEGQVGSIGAIGGGGLFPVELEIAALKTTLGINGKVGTPDGTPKADVKLTVQGGSLGETLMAAASLEPGLKDLELPVKGAFKIATSLKLDGPTRVSFSDLQAAIGPIAVTGRVAADLGGKRPDIDVSLKTGVLNLDELRSRETRETAPASTAEKATDKEEAENPRVFPDDPLPLDSLMAANARISFDAEKIIVDGMDISDVSVNLTLQNGRMELKPLGAVFAGGQINANIILDASKKTAALKARVDARQIDYGQLLSERGLTDIAKGKVDMDINVSGSGSSVRRLMAGLNGKARIVTKDGRLESGALELISSDLTNVFSGEDNQIIRCGVLHFNITKGMADAHAVVFETPGISVVGTGSANLADETLKLRVDPRSKKANLATVAMVPVDVIGTFAKPDWKLDVAGVAGNVAAGAARTTGAVATLGLSLLVEKIAKETVIKSDPTDYCTPALAGKKVTPGEMKEAKAPEAETNNSKTPPPAKKNNATETLKSIGKSLGGLLGD